MKRSFALVTFVLLFSPFLFAEHFDAPMHFYESAHIGLYLPGDTEIEEEDGVWYAYSESAEMMVTFEEAESYVAPEDISEESLLEAMAYWEIEDFVFLSVKENGAVTFAYGQGWVTDDDGESYEGFFGILTNTDVEDTTFLFSVTAESLMNQKSGEPAEEVVSDIYSMDPM